MTLLTCNNPNFLTLKGGDETPEDGTQASASSPPLFTMVLPNADAAHRKMALVPVLQLSSETQF